MWLLPLLASLAFATEPPAGAADALAGPGADEVMALSKGAAGGDAAALAALGARCDAGSGLACGNLASILRGGAGGPARVAEAPSLLERGCAAGWAMACGDLGFMLVRGDGAAVDLVRGYRYTRQGCDKGFLPSCGEAAQLLVSGAGVAADAAAARTLFARACDGESWRYCTQLAAMHEQGAGGVVDLVKAEDTYILACTHGQVEACGRLPWVVEAEGELERAFRSAEELCDQNVALACVWSGTASRKGKGTIVDPGAAERRYTQACNVDEAMGCAGLAAVHLEAGHTAKANAALKRACSLGMKAACDVGPAVP